MCIRKRKAHRVRNKIITNTVIKLPTLFAQPHLQISRILIGGVVLHLQNATEQSTAGDNIEVQ